MGPFMFGFAYKIHSMNETKRRHYAISRSHINDFSRWGETL